MEGEAVIDMSSLLGSLGTGDPERNGQRGRVQTAAHFIRQAGNARMMRESSMLVRETAAEQLEERQSDWAYSRPVVVLDLIWNLAFVLVALVVVALGKNERPATPLRIWVLGYALQCVLHMLCVCCEYNRRQQRRHAMTNQTVAHYMELSDFDAEGESEILPHASLAKRLESANTMFSFVWWIIGFYWITVAGQVLTHDSPRLYWLCVVFLAFDVFFVVFCIALACVIGIAVCCCLPCIIAILYAVADQEGASEEDIRLLPKSKFKALIMGGVMLRVGASGPANERLLSSEDAECCICLSSYEDGAELRELPCGHHFHDSCIGKWLRINATCPLCKYNIIHKNDNRKEEV